MDLLVTLVTITTTTEYTVRYIVYTVMPYTAKEGSLIKLFVSWKWFILSRQRKRENREKTLMDRHDHPNITISRCWFRVPQKAINTPYSTVCECKGTGIVLIIFLLPSLPLLLTTISSTFFRNTNSPLNDIFTLPLQPLRPTNKKGKIAILLFEILIRSLQFLYLIR